MNIEEIKKQLKRKRTGNIFTISYLVTSIISFILAIVGIFIVGKITCAILFVITIMNLFTSVMLLFGKYNSLDNEKGILEIVDRYTDGTLYYAICMRVFVGSNEVLKYWSNDYLFEVYDSLYDYYNNHPNYQKGKVHGQELMLTHEAIPIKEIVWPKSIVQSHANTIFEFHYCRPDGSVIYNFNK